MDVASNIVSKISEKLLVKIDLRELISEFFHPEKYILVFDDLERCNMDINRVLGYINRFVEHDGAKVIIIADQEKIGKAH